MQRCVLVLAVLALALAMPAAADEMPASTTASTNAATATKGTNKPTNVTTAAPVVFGAQRCGAWFNGRMCPNDQNGRELYCSQWGFCAWENEPAQLDGKYYNPDSSCSTTEDCEPDRVPGVTCDTHYKKCMLILMPATTAPEPPTSGAATIGAVGSAVLATIALALVMQ